MQNPLSLLRFGTFEVNPLTGELRKNNIRIKLNGQSFQLLLLLATRSGELVTREEIRIALWPHETVVEWEHSINTAIKRIRAALNDSASTPRFVETLPKRGYRFLADVERVERIAAPAQVNRPQSLAPAATDDWINPIGRTISHYRVLDELGRGGMGVVYKAEDLLLGRPAALKFLPYEHQSDPLAVGRFQREARMASALNHPNICTIYEIEMHQGRAFIAMELLEGESLRDRLDRLRAPFSTSALVDLAIPIANALEAAHEHGIVHRDIKPGNIFLGQRGEIKVLDFGLAKSVSRRPARAAAGPAASDSYSSDAANLTNSGLTPGTLAYMSPEQIRGDELDARSDLYSLGVVLFEIAAGQLTGPTGIRSLPSTIIRRHPPKLWEILGRMLETDRALRYQSAADVASELKRLKRDSSSGVDPVLASPPARRHYVLAAASVVALGLAALAWFT